MAPVIHRDLPANGASTQVEPGVAAAWGSLRVGRRGGTAVPPDRRWSHSFRVSFPSPHGAKLPPNVAGMRQRAPPPPSPHWPPVAAPSSPGCPGAHRKSDADSSDFRYPGCSPGARAWRTALVDNVRNRAAEWVRIHPFANCSRPETGPSTLKPRPSRCAHCAPNASMLDSRSRAYGCGGGRRTILSELSPAVIVFDEFQEVLTVPGGCHQRRTARAARQRRNHRRPRGSVRLPGHRPALASSCSRGVGRGCLLPPESWHPAPAKLSLGASRRA
jgi:hypothetical protein